MWTEESLGTRINHLRTDEIIASGAPLVAAACPFCLTMLRDGLKDKGRGDIRSRTSPRSSPRGCRGHFTPVLAFSSFS